MWCRICGTSFEIHRREKPYCVCPDCLGAVGASAGLVWFQYGNILELCDLYGGGWTGWCRCVGQQLIWHDDIRELERPIDWARVINGDILVVVVVELFKSSPTFHEMSSIAA